VWKYQNKITRHSAGILVVGVADSLAHAGGVGLWGIRMLCAAAHTPRYSTTHSQTGNQMIV